MATVGHFVSGEMKTFAAGGGKRKVELIIPSSLAVKFNTVSKSVPADLAKNWNGFQIVWINNIGLEAKITGADIDQGEYYEIQFIKPQIANVVESILVYWDGQSIRTIGKNDYEEISGGKIAVRMQLIDPPVGWGGR